MKFSKNFILVRQSQQRAFDETRRDGAALPESNIKSSNGARERKMESFAVSIDEQSIAAFALFIVRHSPCGR
jgi:hypothetical protein